VEFTFSLERRKVKVDLLGFGFLKVAILFENNRNVPHVISCSHKRQERASIMLDGCF
jgi:hypothetical protein